MTEANPTPNAGTIQSLQANLLARADLFSLIDGNSGFASLLQDINIAPAIQQANTPKPKAEPPRQETADQDQRAAAKNDKPQANEPAPVTKSKAESEKSDSSADTKEARNDSNDTTAARTDKTDTPAQAGENDEAADSTDQEVDDEDFALLEGTVANDEKKDEDSKQDALTITGQQQTAASELKMQAPDVKAGEDDGQGNQDQNDAKNTVSTQLIFTASSAANTDDGNGTQQGEDKSPLAPHLQPGGVTKTSLDTTDSQEIKTAIQTSTADHQAKKTEAAAPTHGEQLDQIVADTAQTTQHAAQSSTATPAINLATGQQNLPETLQAANTNPSVNSLDGKLFDPAAKTLQNYSAAAQLTAPKDAQASAASAPRIIEQVAIKLNQHAKDGNDQLTIQLRPADLGRIDIKLEIRDGTVTGLVTADNQQTLDMLAKDSRSLERALQDAGLRADPGSLSFELRDPGNQQSAQQNDGGNNGRSSETILGIVNELNADGEDTGEVAIIETNRVNLRV